MNLGRSIVYCHLSTPNFTASRAHTCGTSGRVTLCSQRRSCTKPTFAWWVAGGRTPQNRTQLFALAARLMREILVDHARRRLASKRGGSAMLVELDDSIEAAPGVSLDVLALDQALTELHAMDARLCQVVELKFFAGLTIDETAEALAVSTATVERDWTVSRAWLHQRLSM
jgi:RNA polymerase sigma factor (TIGR02999 family)